jgi:hypothetical protein
VKKCSGSTTQFGLSQFSQAHPIPCLLDAKLSPHAACEFALLLKLEDLGTVVLDQYLLASSHVGPSYEWLRLRNSSPTSPLKEHHPYTLGRQPYFLLTLNTTFSFF